MVPQVLVIGADSLSTNAAYAATEASGWIPVTLFDHEFPCQAIERVLPAYVMIDAAHPAATDFATYLVATRCRTRVLLYGTEALALIMRQAALRFGATTIDVPFDSPYFSSAIEHRLDAEEWLAGWLDTRRLSGTHISHTQQIKTIEP